MGVMNVQISDDVEMEFRRLVLEVKGKKKGALSKAVEEAMKLWIAAKSKEVVG